jgi:outer membrane immunogenic protein
VLGVEADIQGAGINDSFNQSPAPGAACCKGHPDDIFHGTSNLDWFATVRGRLGYAFDRTLVYFTGGFAYGGIDQHITATDPSLPLVFFDLKKDGTRTGYVLGAGFEHQIASSWTIKAEYKYLNFGSDSLTSVAGADNPDTHTNRIENDFHTVSLGLNYHIGPSYEPLK